MSTDFDEEAFREVEAILKPARTSQDDRDEMVDRLDEILIDCALLGPGEDGKISVAAAMDYLDQQLATRPGVLHWIILDWRWPIASYVADERGIEGELAALLRGDSTIDEPTAELPMTCPAPEAHAREAAGHEVTFWQKALGRQPKPDQNRSECAYCGKPLPRSHRRKS